MDKNEILVVYGDRPAEMAMKLAEEAGLAELIGSRNKRIGLKPNLVVSRPASEGATTHPEIAAGLIAYLKKNGFANIVILEGSWVGSSASQAFTVCGYRGLAKEAGVELIDTQTDKASSRDCRGLNIDICNSALAVDFMINLPVMKGHCQTLLTCALKNNKGLIPDSEKRRFHSMGLNKPIAHLNTAVRSDFIVVDGISGDLDFEEGGNPVFAGRMFASRDPVLCDAWAAELMGFRINEIPYIGMAEKLKVGSTGPARVRELNKSSDLSLPAVSRPQGKVKQLSLFIREDSACSACYASLIFALSRLGSIERKGIGEICVGQGYRGLNSPGSGAGGLNPGAFEPGRKTVSLGAGQCTSGFASFCPGCPPTGAELLSFLKNRIHR